MKHLLIFLILISTTIIYGQGNHVATVLISRESDYSENYKPRTRDQILINYNDGIVYYRKNPKRKFKKSDLSPNAFFQDSIDYQKLGSIIVAMTKDADPTCMFRNKGSIVITIVQGNSHQNVTRSYEFGSVISCSDDKEFLLLKRIEQEYFRMIKLLFD